MPALGLVSDQNRQVCLLISPLRWKFASSVNITLQRANPASALRSRIRRTYFDKSRNQDTNTLLAHPVPILKLPVSVGISDKQKLNIYSRIVWIQLSIEAPLVYSGNFSTKCCIRTFLLPKGSLQQPTSTSKQCRLLYRPTHSRTWRQSPHTSSPHFSHYTMALFELFTLHRLKRYQVCYIVLDV